MSCAFASASERSFSAAVRGRLANSLASFSKSMADRSTRPPASSPSMIGAVIATPSIFSSSSASIFAETAEMSTGPSLPRIASARTCSVATGFK